LINIFVQGSCVEIRVMASLTSSW